MYYIRKTLWREIMLGWWTTLNNKDHSICGWKREKSILVLFEKLTFNLSVNGWNTIILSLFLHLSEWTGDIPRYQRMDQGGQKIRHRQFCSFGRRLPKGHLNSFFSHSHQTLLYFIATRWRGVLSRSQWWRKICCQRINFRKRRIN